MTVSSASHDADSIISDTSAFLRISNLIFFGNVMQIALTLASHDADGIFSCNCSLGWWLCFDGFAGSFCGGSSICGCVLEHGLVKGLS